MNMQFVSLLSLLLLPLASPTNRPGSAFSVNVISDIETAAPLKFTPEDIAICCSGIGDFGFMLRDLQIGALATDTENEGFDAIPGSTFSLVCDNNGFNCFSCLTFACFSISDRQSMVVPSSLPRPCKRL